MLRRFMPRSLLWRSLLIIGTPLILVQIISLWVFYDRHIDTITRRMANSLSGEIALTVNHLQQYPEPADLVWILSEVQTKLTLRATYKPGEQLENTEHRGADTRVGGVLLRAMQQRMRETPFVIDTESMDKHVQVSIELENGVLHVVTTLKKLSSITTELFVMWSVGSSLVFLIIAAIFMRNQVRPIRRLAHAADSFGKGRDVPDFKPSGATEVRQASTAFIIMRERIKRQMQQRTEMLAGISHDLRTPITRMKLQLAMLPDEPGVEELRGDVADMEQMIEEYLAFARGEGAEQAIETNLPVLLEDVANTASRNGHSVSLKTRGNLRAMVRPGAFKRCVNNLINNAARFGDRIEIQAQRRSGFIEVTVDDNGPGVPEDKRRDVFKPFFRVDGARSPESGGAGLGLTIARDIVRSHGGEILLADSPLGGLRAILRLPV